MKWISLLFLQIIRSERKKFFEWPCFWTCFSFPYSKVSLEMFFIHLIGINFIIQKLLKLYQYLGFDYWFFCFIQALLHLMIPLIKNNFYDHKNLIYYFFLKGTKNDSRQHKSTNFEMITFFLKFHETEKDT